VNKILSNSVRRPGPVSAELSPTDRRILEVLRDNARTPNNVIAAEVGVAPSTCLVRIRSLEDRGVITGYHAEIDPEALGVAIQAMIAVRLRAGARDKLREFTDQVVARPEVMNVYFLAGQDDFLLHVAVADPGALRDFVLEQLSANPQVAATQTHLIFEHLRGAAGTSPGSRAARSRRRQIR
jgi:DNA-binding Lrp family transcriptional regulator